MGIEVQIRETCPACEGAKIVSHPLWLEYAADRDQQERERQARATGGLDAETAAYRAWWSDRGFHEPRGLDRLAVGHGYPAIPPEEIPCDECEGQGTRARWVDVDEFYDLVIRAASRSAA